MSERPLTTDDWSGSTDDYANTTRDPVKSVSAQPTLDLRLTIVKYHEQPDRGTIHPPELTGSNRMETWLTANMSAFVALSEWQ
ncbi:DUF7511 domain-containing protein [Halorussus aquaticus]